jgi:hypothetical protein
MTAVGLHPSCRTVGQLRKYSPVRQSQKSLLAQQTKQSVYAKT